MEQTYIPHAEFKSFLQDQVKARVAELLKEIQTFEFIKRDRGLFMWERARFNSLGRMLEINETIIKSLDPEYQSIQ